MNPVFKAAAASLSGGWVMGAMTVVFLAFFAGWTWWAWRPASRDLLAAAARLPLDDEGGEA